MKGKKILAQSISIGLLAAAFLVSPWTQTASQAATPTCTSMANHKSRSGTRTIAVPVTSGGSEKCVRGPHGSPSRDSTRAIQLALDLCYSVDLGSGGIDGIYGPRTIAGVKKVQALFKLTVDGVYGPATHNAMQFRYAAEGNFGCASAVKV